MGRPGSDIELRKIERWNQALFERLIVYDDDIQTTDIAEPFATLADPELPVGWIVRPSAKHRFSWRRFK